MNIIDALKTTVEAVKKWTSNELTNKVDKEGNKKLTDENYSSADKTKVSNMATGLAVLDGKLYLTNNDGIIEESATTLPSGGGGGGGGSSSASITLNNLLDSNEITVAYGGSANLVFEYASSETDKAAQAYIYLSGNLKKTYSINPGTNTIDIGELIGEGVNDVKLTVSDIYSNSKSLSFVVNAVSLKLTSTFDDSQIFSGDVTIRYIPTGLISKDVHMVLDGVDTVIDTTSETGKQRTYVISSSKLYHGVHDIVLYLSAEVNGISIVSNKLYFSIISVDAGATTPVISSVCTVDTLTQGEQLQINYLVYDPVNLTTQVTLTISQGGKTYSTAVRTVDRTRQTWFTRDYPVGEDVVFTITYGNISRTHIVTIVENQIDISIKETDLEFQLSAAGKSNNDDDRDTWESGEVTTTFSNINWDSTGWVDDENGDTVLRLSGDAKAVINFEPFKTDARSTGRTLELVFAIRDVNDRKAIAISCMDDAGIGFFVTADTSSFSSEQTSVSCNYTDEERVAVTYVVEPRTENRMLSVYLNGVLSGVKQYQETDNFQQSLAKSIEIGSSYCSVDLYSIRSYDTALTASEVRDNYIAGIADVTTKLSLYEDNDVYDSYGNLSFSKVQNKLPVFLITGELPTYKGDKKKVIISFTHPEKPTLNYEDAATLDVQGTSSQFSKLGTVLRNQYDKILV